MDLKSQILPLVAGIVALAASVCAEPPAERTLSYEADLVGHDNGSLSVKETFTVITTGSEITTTPARYLQEDFDGAASIGIVVKRICRDGLQVTYDTARENEFRVIYLGRRDEPLPPGTHTFEAEYELDRFTGETNGTTSLMWKAVPAGWPMQVDRVRVHIRLPRSILSGLAKFYGFTGLAESEDQELEITRDKNNGADYVNRHPIPTGERFDAIAAWSTPYAGEERILRFNTEIVLNANGGADISERIEARALGQDIRHGIKRYLLRRDRGNLGTWRYFSYDVRKASIDGQPTPSEQDVDESGDFTVVRVGRADSFIEKGERTFTLAYLTGDQFICSPGRDQFYWNVTGGARNELPVDQVTAYITLPPGVSRSNISWRAWTGRTGSTNSAFEAWFDQKDRLVFLARDLSKDEAFTIQLDMPGGTVTKPSGSRCTWEFIRDNSQLVPAAGGFLAMALYLAIAWYRHGRDPAKGIIIPIYDSPQGLSPGQIRHIMRMGYDDRCFSSDVLDLATRGLIEIRIDGKHHYIRRTGKPAGGIPPDEEQALSKLFENGTEVEIGEPGYKPLVSVRDAIRDAVDRTCDPYFFENGAYAACGLMISFFTLLPAVYLAPAGHKAMCLLWTVLMIPMTLLAVWLAFVAFRKWKYLLLGRVPAGRGIGLALLASLLASGAAWLEWQLVAETADDTSLPMALILAATVFLNYVSWDVMRAPSALGRALMDRIERFRMYLEVGEKDILEHATRIGVKASRMPERTVELYEKHLPYALALDVENEWAGKFSDLLAAAHVSADVKPGTLSVSHAIVMMSRGTLDFHKALESPANIDVHGSPAGSGRTAWSVASLVGGAVISGFAGGGRGGGGVGGW